MIPGAEVGRMGLAQAQLTREGPACAGPGRLCPQHALPWPLCRPDDLASSCMPSQMSVPMGQTRIRFNEPESTVREGLME